MPDVGQWANFAHVTVDGTSPQSEIQLSKNVVAKASTRMLIKFNDAMQNWSVHALTGPTPGGSTGQGSFESGTPAAVFVLTDGWVYYKYTGRQSPWRLCRSSRVAVDGYGTEFILQKGSTKDRIYFLGPSGSKAIVNSLNIPPGGNPNDPDYHKELTTPDTYVEIGDDGKLSAITNFSSSEQDFVDHVLEEADRAEM